MAVVFTRCAHVGEAAEHVHAVAYYETLVVGIFPAGHPHASLLPVGGCQCGGALHGVLQAAYVTLRPLVAYVYAVCAGNVGHAVVRRGTVIHVAAFKVRFVEVFEEQFACPRCLAKSAAARVVEPYVAGVCSGYARCAVPVYVINHVTGYGVFPRRAVHVARPVFGYIYHCAVLGQVGFVCSEVGRTAEVAFATGNVGCKFCRCACGFVY